MMGDTGSCGITAVPTLSSGWRHSVSSDDEVDAQSILGNLLRRKQACSSKHRSRSLTESSSCSPIMDPCWMSSPVYRRYWLHYQQAMAWHHTHRRAYQKALEAAWGHGHGQGFGYHRRYADWETRESEGQEDEEEESSSDDEIECDVSNMEISEELRQYFAQTERHREELKKQQQMEAELHESYVPADQDLHGASWRGSTAPPHEQPGERRKAEMKKLYGEDAAKIMAMEAAMQLTFDRNRDLKQPKYWPVIPLKL